MLHSLAFSRAGLVCCTPGRFSVSLQETPHTHEWSGLQRASFCTENICVNNVRTHNTIHQSATFTINTAGDRASTRATFTHVTLFFPLPLFLWLVYLFLFSSAASPNNASCSPIPLPLSSNQKPRNSPGTCRSAVPVHDMTPYIDHVSSLSPSFSSSSEVFFRGRP